MPSNGAWGNVSEDVTLSTGSPSTEAFAEGFREMYYVINVSREDFDVDAFRSSLSANSRDRDTAVAPVAPLDEVNGPYHVIFGWRLAEKELDFFVSYRVGPKKHESDEHEPYAEQFMGWFSPSFKQSTVQAHVHARFEFPHAGRESKFRLPQAVGDTEIYGIRLRVPLKTTGVSTVNLTKGKSRWLVEVIGDRVLSLVDFSPYNEVRALASFVDTLWAKEAS